MRRIKTLIRTFAISGLALLLAQAALAVPVTVTYIGTWDSTGSGNTSTGGPGMAAGQRYVIVITYDDAATVTTGVDVLDGFFLPSGNTMQTLDLTDAGHSIDIFVPMEGLDGLTPYIYTQNETDHFPAFIPAPTLNFIDGSPFPLNSADIIGMEFEGNFDTGGNFNIIELFNTSPGGGTVNMVTTILNCGNAGCSAAAPAVTDTNGLSLAVGLVVDAGAAPIVYSAGALTQTTASAITQSNDLDWWPSAH